MSVKTEQEQFDEIERDRRTERHLIVQALVALAVVAVFVAVRVAIVG
jgi:hypothetical protein